MTKATTALSLSLALLLAIIGCLLLVNGPPASEGRGKPQGRAPEKPFAEPGRVVSAAGEQPQAPKAKADEPLPPRKQGPGKPHAGPARWLPFDFQVGVYAQGAPVEGAWVFARKVEYGIDGYPERGVLQFRPDDERRSDPTGQITCRMFYPEDSADDDLFEVYAYNPEIGIGFQELTFADLKRLDTDELAINLERGKAVTGKVVDENGHPRGGVKVMLTMHSRAGRPLTGLCTQTADDGSFLMRGVTFQNTPFVVLASYSTRHMDKLDPTRGYVVGNPFVMRGKAVHTQKGVQESDYKPDSETWDVGAVTLEFGDEASWNQVRPLEGVGSRG